MDHDSVAKDFTIAQTSEPSFVDVYDVIITGLIEQFDNSGNTFSTTTTIEFTLSVNPCTVDSFDSISPPIGTIEYTLDQPGITFGFYQFE